MTADRAWIADRVGHAPSELRLRILRDIVRMEGATRLPDALADAGRAALERALAAPADRASALDLLAADGLITLALLAQAEAGPEGLGEFAERLVHAYAART